MRRMILTHLVEYWNLRAFAEAEQEMIDQVIDFKRQLPYAEAAAGFRRAGSGWIPVAS